MSGIWQTSVSAGWGKVLDNAFVGSKPTGRTSLTTQEHMSKQKDTIEKAYGNIPKEPVFYADLFDGLPTPRGVKYYWLKLLRFLTR